MHSIVLIIFHIGNFLSVNGSGHALCNSFRNEHAVILLDMMLRARIAIMNMRAMVVIMIGSITMKRKKVEREEKEHFEAQKEGAEFVSGAVAQH